MANSSLVLSSLDFNTLKQNFREFMKSQDTFKDYDFDGPNISVLLDVMSYNSYLNSFYMNMVASEMFLDSAQRYDSIVSHSKELNYLPQSATSAAAIVEFEVITTGITQGYLSIPKGTKFTGVNSNGTFDYATREKYEFKSPNTTFKVSNVFIYEGSYFKDSYIVNYDVENQRFLISNKNMDINSINVNVSDRIGGQTAPYTRAKTLFGLNQQSNVFFIQAAENNLYEIVFGDGYFGNRPINGSTVTVDYMVCNGSEGNDIRSVTLSDDLGRINGGIAEPQLITITMEASGGANQESIDSVRFSAPRYFAAQQRAVSTDDYYSLIREKFQGEIGDVSIIGGETIEPKQYGTVIVSIKPTAGVIVPDYVKSRVAKYMRDYIAIPNRIKFTDPSYFFCGVKTKVEYDIFATNKTTTEINSAVLSSIVNYSKNNLEKFNSDLRYSRLVSTIDNADDSITSNETELRMIKRIAPKFNYLVKETYKLNNAIYVDPNATKHSHEDEDHVSSELNTNNYEFHFDHSSVISSIFTYNRTDDITGAVTNYPFSFFEDNGVALNEKGELDPVNGKGKLTVYTFTVNNKLIMLDVIGSVDYNKGIIQLDKLRANDYESYISIYIKTKAKDLIAKADNIIMIDANDIEITAKETVQ